MATLILQWDLGSGHANAVSPLEVAMDPAVALDVTLEHEHRGRPIPLLEH